MPFDWLAAAGLILASSLVAISALAVALALWRRHAPVSPGIFDFSTDPIVIILDGEMLVDATPAGRALVESGPEVGSARFRMLARLEPLFPGLGRHLDALERDGRIVLCSGRECSPALTLRAEFLGGLTRLTLIEDDPPEAGGGFADEPLLRAELAALNAALDHAPVPMWRRTDGGELVWANGAYLQLAAARAEAGTELAWPLPDLFDGTETGEGEARDDEDGRRPSDGCPLPRRTIRTGATLRRYEIASTRAGTDTIHLALPADRLHRAEVAREGMLQTLGQTFAQLPTGLAVFDRQRLLQLFNPAFGELSGVSAASLARRPTLTATLDAMRARATVPEPNDYRLWRQRIARMEGASATGLFQEVWALPSGRSHRATVRPFPDGALAFMIEDITGEMARSRRQRAESDLAHAVMNEIDDALIVFSRDGVVTMVNDAARELWGPGLEVAGDRHGGPTALALLRSRTAPTLLWDDISRYIGHFGSRKPREATLRMIDGRLLSCRIAPLPQGASLLRFLPAGVERPATAGGIAPDPAGQTILTA